MFFIWKMFDRRKSKLKCFTIISILFFVTGILFLDCFCSEKKCSWNSSSSSEIRVEQPIKSLNLLTAVNNFSEEDLDKRFAFNPDVDVFIFLHIQKTGGTTFGQHLVRNTNLREPCICFKNRKKCDCRTSKNYIWLFSRHSTGWGCGLHADWTELHDCVPQYLDGMDHMRRERRYLYFTILRDPLQRYLSEWKHVQRGSTWITARLMCGGRPASREEVPLCFKGRNWMGVSFDEFTACDSNLANNRQTRMVSNLSLVGCYDKSIVPEVSLRDKMMLQSAKDNLRSMAFFGLTEYQAETRFLFEYTFEIKFTMNFTQFNETHASRTEVTSAERDTLMRLNSLDVEFYSFAKDLFFARVLYARMQQKFERKEQESLRREQLRQSEKQKTEQAEADEQEEVLNNRQETRNWKHEIANASYDGRLYSSAIKHAVTSSSSAAASSSSSSSSSNSFTKNLADNENMARHNFKRVLNDNTDYNYYNNNNDNNDDDDDGFIDQYRQDDNDNDDDLGNDGNSEVDDLGDESDHAGDNVDGGLVRSAVDNNADNKNTNNNNNNNNNNNSNNNSNISDNRSKLMKQR